ncbi:ATP-dependent OLD family endonuclease [Candidatus Nitrotoga sp. BS]|uniref:AAA family ATPase n=1 Tax=Candidatus Nitrotoga sp. BS TaxID=2890408 RepID=UPI001EF2D01E|nr:AAA family ATPase [Candidatus Nitrotoga sp. BS]CAH1204111.1 ATP-dependent OLD family endonuclease [Candidatus Nitrotoga sp. BS]
MKLKRYQVFNFRSVKESGWIDSDGVTALIGVNESGKTNLLLPLWKLNPAREGEIQPTSDFPKRMFGEIRENPAEYCFITAEFEVNELANDLSAITNAPRDQVSLIHVTRYFDSHYEITFPNHRTKRSISFDEVKITISDLKQAIDQIEPFKQEDSLKTLVIQAASKMATDLQKSGWVDEHVANAIETLKKLLPENPAKTSTLVPRVSQTLELMESWLSEIRSPAPQEDPRVEDLVLAALPKFVYYSNYGNLDSEIYLPHVVENLKREDLGAKESAKARTLRVLFNFVRLQPEEILELGQDFQDQSRSPTTAEVAIITEKKRERSILLQSAGTTLTESFKDWWKQGDYRFRFEADGNHFRIWVSDHRRPEEVELESRSTGLQWFLSFYLVFLVESQRDHQGAILLLDEPGLSLHPLAQRDLSAFFDGLVQSNQIIYTTHSPFLVDADRLDRVRKVFVAEDGTTKSSSNLRQSGSDVAQAGAAYAVYSALNLSVTESLLLGCTPVVVEGQSDQHYLTLIKALLIGAGKISPCRELVFPPAGGTKTLRMTAAILTGRDERLPVVLLDGDEMGARMAKELTTSLYDSEREKVLSTDSYAGFKGSELEDLIPLNRFSEAIDRIFREPERSFSEVAKPGLPIIPQVEDWAKNESVDLPKGWKVDVARRVKTATLMRGIQDVEEKLVNKWVQMFETFDQRPD